MDSLQKAKFSQDKVRNGSNWRSIFYLWCYRTWCQNSTFSFNKFFARFCLEIYKMLGMGILTKNIGGGVRLQHLNGIYIHNNAILGENCTIYQQVTIGLNEHKENYNLAAQIGDRVYIGAGAKIIGNVKIGNDVRIGANAVVTKDVPSGKTVVGLNKIIDVLPERKGII